MEIKNVITFEIQKEERLYKLEMPAGAPLGEAYECVGAFMDKMVELINDHQEKIKQEKEDNGKEDPEKS